MKDFIIWFIYEGVEDYTIISASSEGMAVDMFNRHFGLSITECHVIED